MDSFSEVHFSILEYLDTGPIGKFGLLLKRAVDEEADVEEQSLASLMEKRPDYPWEQESRELVLGELWQVRELGATFLLVALNQSLETAISHCLDEVFANWPNQSKEQQAALKKDKKHRRGSVMDRLRLVIPEMETIPGFEGVNELRHIVNAWKHDGHVSKKLAAAFPQWKPFHPLDNLDEDYVRLKAGVAAFSGEIGARLHEKWRALRRLSRASSLDSEDV